LFINILIKDEINQLSKQLFQKEVVKKYISELRKNIQKGKEKTN